MNVLCAYCDSMGSRYLKGLKICNWNGFWFETHWMLLMMLERYWYGSSLGQRLNGY